MNIKEHLKIVVVEFSPFWKNKKANFNYLNKLLENVETDLIILPEMFNTGFCMESVVISEKENGITFEFMQKLSTKLKCCILGSFAVEEESRFYNRIFVVNQGELIAKYNKRHLFTYAKEHKNYAKGRDKVVFDLFGWKLNLTICYDLRFPVWNKNADNYDILINVASFPKSRIHAWNTLLDARAIENQCYTVGCNRTGIDGNKIEYNGSSKVVDFSGKILNPNKAKSELLEYKLSYSKLIDFREKYPFLKDSDSFEINNL
ncbi:MAG: nitrilase family protein [Flavobacteriales bacterium]|nr:nitrilase family protein [Flavobacteriales bacterium]